MKLKKLLPKPLKKLARRVIPADTLSLWQQPQLRALGALLPDGAEPISYYCVGARGSLSDDLHYLRRQGKFRLIGFEAEAKEAQWLRETGHWDTIVAGALGGSDAQATLYVTQHPGCSSCYEPHAENVERWFDQPQWFRVVQQQSVQLNRLDTIVTQQKLPPPEILQIDVQGYELEVLKGAEALLKGVLVINLETHFYPLYRGQPLFPEVHAYLTAMGFMLMYFRKCTEGFGGRFIEADACYISDRHPPDNHRLRAAFGYFKCTGGAAVALPRNEPRARWYV